jgi:DUF4097 and DUF4098 domain-containing protein YvlB
MHDLLSTFTSPKITETMTVHTGKLTVHTGKLTVHTGKLTVHTSKLTVHTGNVTMLTGTGDRPRHSLENISQKIPAAPSPRRPLQNLI